MTETMDLMPVANPDPSKIFVAGGVDSLLAEIDQRARSVVVDPTTAKGRKECSSLAYKVSQTKTFLDDLGKDHVAGLKAQAKEVDAERKKARDFLDALRDDIRQPVTDYENREKERVAAIKRRIDEFNPVWTSGPHGVVPITDIEAAITSLKAIDIDESFAEFQDEAATKRDAALFSLYEFLNSRREEEAQEAERKKAEEAARKEREEQIAKEAADNARREAEAKAQADKYRAELARQQEERRRLDAEKRAAEAEEHARIAAEEAVRREREAAEQKRRQQEHEEQARKRDKEHRALVHNAIMSDLMTHAALDQETAKNVVIAIAKGNIQNVRVEY